MDKTHRHAPPKSSQSTPPTPSPATASPWSTTPGGNTDLALTEFTTLIQHNPDYVPAYQMSAQTLAKLAAPKKPSTACTMASPPPTAPEISHAAGEMQALLDDLSR